MSIRHLLTLSAIPILAAMSINDLALAQSDNARGLQLGLHAGMTQWDLDDVQGNEFEKESGMHFGGSLGWGMSDWLGVFTRLDYTSISPENIDSYGVTHWDVGIRAMPQMFGFMVRPYAEAFGSFRFLKLTEPNGFEISASGPAIGVGAGLYVFVTPQIAVNGGVSAAFGNLEDVSFGGIPDRSGRRDIR